MAVESCEFWAAFCDSQLESDVLRPFLPRILPVRHSQGGWHPLEHALGAVFVEALQLESDVLWPFLPRTLPARISGSVPTALSQTCDQFAYPGCWQAEAWLYSHCICS